MYSLADAAEPDSRILALIDQEIVTGLTGEKFQVAVAKILEELAVGMTHSTESDSDKQRDAAVASTSAYLFSRISSQLIYSKDDNDVKRLNSYSKVLTTLIPAWFRKDGRTFSHMAVSALLEIICDLYDMHAYTMLGGSIGDAGENIPLVWLRQFFTYNFQSQDRYLHVNNHQGGAPWALVVTRDNEAQIDEKGNFMKIEVGLSNTVDLPPQFLATTWNMRGYAGGVERAWSDEIYGQFLRQGQDVVALQSVGDGALSAARPVKKIAVYDQYGRQWSVAEYSWRPQGANGDFRIFFLDDGGAQANSAIVLPADQGQGGLGRLGVARVRVVADAYHQARAILGVELSSAGHSQRASIYSFQSARKDDAASLREIARHTSTPYAILGSFTSDAESGTWVFPHMLADIVKPKSQALTTDNLSKTLDYAVVFDALSPKRGRQNGVSRKIGNSDHYAVTGIAVNHRD